MPLPRVSFLLREKTRGNTQAAAGAVSISVRLPERFGSLLTVPPLGQSSGRALHLRHSLKSSPEFSPPPVWRRAAHPEDITELLTQATIRSDAPSINNYFSQRSVWTGRAEKRAGGRCIGVAPSAQTLGNGSGGWGGICARARRRSVTDEPHWRQGLPAPGSGKCGATGRLRNKCR